VHVGPVQGEGFALAQSGADEDLEEVGERVLDNGAVAQEGDGVVGQRAELVDLNLAVG